MNDYSNRNRIKQRQSDLKNIWYDALTSSPLREIMVVKTTGYDPKTNQTVDKVKEKSIIRRGYKIQYTYSTDMFELFHTNKVNHYKYPSDRVITEFVNNGWLDTVDRHQVQRWQDILDEYNYKIDNASQQRNDSLITHWRNKRQELIYKISSVEEEIKSRSLIKSNQYE